MSEMIDRIARRLCCGGDCRAVIANQSHPNRIVKQECSAGAHTADARAAVKEMMSPTRKMIEAGATALVQRRFGCPPDDEIDVVRIHSRMIEEALK